jgi:hypothetical protein
VVAVSDVLLKDSASTSAAKHRYRNRCYKLWLRGVGSGGNPTQDYDSCNDRLCEAPSTELVRSGTGCIVRTTQASSRLPPWPMPVRMNASACAAANARRRAIREAEKEAEAKARRVSPALLSPL